MSFNPKVHHRRSIRLKDYDYTQAGAYFVTICTHDKECLFGEVVKDVVRLNPFGQILHQEWLQTPVLRPDVVLDGFVVMPNHIHGILCIADDRRGTARRAPTVERFSKPVSGSLPTIMRSFKSAVTKHVNEIRGTPGLPVWQRNYYERIIRDEDEMNRVRRYIANNPLKWALDRDNPNVQEEEPQRRRIGFDRKNGN